MQKQYEKKMGVMNLGKYNYLKSSLEEWVKDKSNENGDEKIIFFKEFLYETEPDEDKDIHVNSIIHEFIKMVDMFMEALNDDMLPKRDISLEDVVEIFIEFVEANSVKDHEVFSLPVIKSLYSYMFRKTLREGHENLMKKQDKDEVIH